MQAKQEIPTVAATAEVKFDQAHLYGQLENNNNPKHKKLKAINTKYNGLCELICNLIISKDLLQKDTKDALPPPSQSASHHLPAT